MITLPRPVRPLVGCSGVLGAADAHTFFVCDDPPEKAVCNRLIVGKIAVITGREGLLNGLVFAECRSGNRLGCQSVDTQCRDRIARDVSGFWTVDGPQCRLDN